MKQSSHDTPLRSIFEKRRPISSHDSETVSDSRGDKTDSDYTPPGARRSPLFVSSSDSSIKLPKHRTRSSNSSQSPSPSPSSANSTPVVNRGAKRKRRTVSAPELDQLSTSSRYLNIEKPSRTPDDRVRDIIEYLNQGLVTKRTSASDKNTSTGKLGHVYIFQDPDEPKFIKIGYGENPPKRMEEHMTKCGFEPFVETFTSKFLFVAEAYKVEHLVHQELGSFRRRFDCDGCGVRHGEFFEVEFDIAKTAVERWIAILELGMYRADHTMDERWMKKMHDHVRNNQPTPAHDTEEGRQKWWNKFGHEMAAAKDAIAKDVSATSSSSQQVTAQGWPVYCIFEACLLFLWSSDGIGRFIWSLNLMAIVVVWALSSLDAFQTLRQGVIFLMSIGKGVRAFHAATFARRKGK